MPIVCMPKCISTLGLRERERVERRKDKNEGKCLFESIQSV